MKNLTPIATGILFIMAIATSHSAPLFSGHDQKVEALLAQMTLDEKIGQMVQADSSALTNKADVKKYFLGSVLSEADADPENGNSPQSWRN